MLVSFTVVAVLVIVLAIILTLPAPDNRLVRVEGRDTLLTQEEVPDWVQWGFMNHGVVSPGWNMTEIDSIDFLNYMGLGDNYTLNIEIYQFSTIHNATFWHDYGLMPRFEYSLNRSQTADSSPIVWSNPGIGTNSSLIVLGFQSALFQPEFKTLTFQQRNIICQIKLISPTGTIDTDGLIKDIANLQNEKIMSYLS